MMFKQKIRFLLGFLIKKLNLSNTGKFILFHFTKIQSFIVLDSNVELYFRRSITGKDFIPFWSDIDVTLIIKDNELGKLRKSLKKISFLTAINPFLKDIELVDGATNLHWLDYSGIKNWNKSAWLSQGGEKLQNKEWKDLFIQEICYNLVWEHRFLYEQLNKKINLFFQKKISRLDLISAYKIIADIEGLLFILKSQTVLSRKDILKSYKLYGEVDKIYFTHDEIKLHFEFIMEKFSVLTNKIFTSLGLILKKQLDDFEEPFEIHLGQIEENIVFFNFKSVFVEDFNKVSLEKYLGQAEGIIVLTPKLYKIYKICGVQEIDILIGLSQKPPYQFVNKYLNVRLLQDYIQAILEKKDELVLFFCRINIEKLLSSRLGAQEALSYTKDPNEDNLSHYVRVRNFILNMQEQTLPNDYIELIHGDKNYNDFLVVNWCFHTICNFKCTYCPDTLHDGAVQGPDLELVLKTCDEIIFQANKEKFFFEFTGGEITYYRKFTELMLELKKREVDTGIISNGSRDLKWWAEHRHLIDHICLSFHCEQGDAEHFYKVVAYLNETVTTHVNIMMPPDQFDTLHAFAKKLASEIQGISISMQPLLENMNGKIFDYTKEQMKILSEHNLPWCSNVLHSPNSDRVTKIYRGSLLKVDPTGATVETNSAELITNAQNNWNNWQCWAGLENIVIDKDGSIYRGWCFQGGKIGSIYSTFELPKKPVHCKANFCHCGLDIMATKKRSL